MTLDDKINSMTRVVMSEIGVLNRGYNPNRDPKTGQFTFGPGGKVRLTKSGDVVAADSFSEAEKKQIRQNAERMVREMKPDDDYLASKIDAIGKDLGLLAKKGPIKEADRMTEKAIEEERGKVFNMKDVVRATIVVDDYSQIQGAVSRIGQDFEVERVKELNAAGYRDVKVNVTMPNSKRTGEFIVIAPEFYTAKAKPTIYDQSGHDFYKIIRGKDTTEAAKLDAIDKSEKIYAQAESDYLARTARGERSTLKKL